MVCFIVSMNFFPLRYTLEDVIHENKYATVYKATHNLTDHSPRTMCLAYLDIAQSARSPSCFAIKVRKDMIDEEAFKDEVCILAKLQRLAPEYFIRCYSAELWMTASDDPMCKPPVLELAMIMERAHSTVYAARTLVAVDSKVQFTTRCIEAVGKAVDCMNNAGYLHGDLKPDNILLVQDVFDPTMETEEVFRRFIANDPCVRCVLADFDTCQLIKHANNLHVGTKYYRAPELVMHVSCKKTVDSWSLAVTAYELLTGTMLFGENDQCTSSSQSTSGKLSASDSYESHSFSDDLEDTARDMRNEVDQLCAISQHLGDFPAGCKVRACYYVEQQPSGAPCLICGYRTKDIIQLTKPAWCVYGGERPNFESSTRQTYPVCLPKTWMDFLALGLQYDPKKRATCGEMVATLA